MINIVIQDTKNTTPVISCDKYFIIARKPNPKLHDFTDFEILNNCSKEEAMMMVGAVVQLFD